MKYFRVLYLNSYSLLLILSGILILLPPFYKISRVFLCFQIIAALKCFMVSFRLFSAWDEKKRMMALLINRNQREFRPDTFKVYMQAPCSRLLVKSVLKQLGQKQHYRDLLIYKPSLLQSIKETIRPVDTKIYINEDVL
ncbi:hypothetical protein AGMMS50293_30890 [Spirochaetia bacterium]|nr:hypothetical protein AGMMS50293_30890 [Spirochaetia bacterium]